MTLVIVKTSFEVWDPDDIKVRLAGKYRVTVVKVLCLLTEAHATRCCRQDLSTSLPKDSRNPACFPIRIPDHDPVYSKEGIQCMEFVRTTNDVSQGCNSGQKAAEQVTATSDLRKGQR